MNASRRAMGRESNHSDSRRHLHAVQAPRDFRPLGNLTTPLSSYTASIHSTSVLVGGTLMSKAVGIDLGTTNSVVSVLEAGEPVVIPNAEGSRTTPSVVAFTKTGEVLVGEVAKRQAITNPDRTIRSVKRHMGTGWTIDIDGKAYTAQEISARILQKLKRDAESYLGQSRHPGRHHRSRVLRRRPAPGHQGGRRDRGPRSAAHHQRADRGRARVRARQGRQRPDDPRVRPRRRHVRRVGPRDRRRRVRSEEHVRQHAPRRRRLGPARHRLDGDRVQERARRRPRRRQDGRAAPEGSGREGEDRAVDTCRRRRSTCRSSPRRPRARCTSSCRSRARASRR